MTTPTPPAKVAPTEAQKQLLHAINREITEVPIGFAAGVQLLADHESAARESAYREGFDAATNAARAELESLRYAVKEKNDWGVYWHDLAQVRLAEKAAVESRVRALEEALTSARTFIPDGWKAGPRIDALLAASAQPAKHPDEALRERIANLETELNLAYMSIETMKNRLAKKDRAEPQDGPTNADIAADNHRENDETIQRGIGGGPGY